MNVNKKHFLYFVIISYPAYSSLIILRALEKENKMRAITCRKWHPDMTILDTVHAKPQWNG